MNDSLKEKLKELVGIACSAHVLEELIGSAGDMAAKLSTASQAPKEPSLRYRGEKREVPHFIEQYYLNQVPKDIEGKMDDVVAIIFQVGGALCATGIGAVIGLPILAFQLLLRPFCPASRRKERLKRAREIWEKECEEVQKHNREVCQYHDAQLAYERAKWEYTLRVEQTRKKNLTLGSVIQKLQKGLLAHQNQKEKLCRELAIAEKYRSVDTLLVFEYYVRTGKATSIADAALLYEKDCLQGVFQKGIARILMMRNRFSPEEAFLPRKIEKLRDQVSEKKGALVQSIHDLVNKDDRESFERITEELYREFDI